jgi:hypothetical protein
MERKGRFLSAAGFIIAAFFALPAHAQSTARLVNASVRAQVGTGGNILITGFVISGTGTETLLIRGDGPALAKFGVTGALDQPSLGVFDSAGTLIASNTGWSTSSTPALIASTSGSVGAFALAPGSADCALIVNLPAGAYTAQVSGIDNAAGVALAEIYEVSSNGTRLVNFSIRGQVGTSANIIISGFVVSGTSAEGFLVRAAGPALAKFGVSGVLNQPSLSVVNATGVVMASNTGWDSGPGVSGLTAINLGSVTIPVQAVPSLNVPVPNGPVQTAPVQIPVNAVNSIPAVIATAASSVGAFPLTPGSADSASLVTLPPGAYTVQVTGVGNTTGVALAEIYELPATPPTSGPVISPGSG